MPSRKSFTKKDRLRLFKIYGGVCHLCSTKIDSTVEAYEIEHVIPWALTQDDSDGNLRLAHVKCHRIKTHGPERAMLNKTERIRLKAQGHWPKSRTPIQSRGFEPGRNAR